MKVGERKSTPHFSPSVLDGVFNNLARHKVALHELYIRVGKPIGCKNPGAAIRISRVMRKNHHWLLRSVLEYEIEIAAHTLDRVIGVDQYIFQRDVQLIETGQRPWNHLPRIADQKFHILRHDKATAYLRFDVDGNDMLRELGREAKAPAVIDPNFQCTAGADARQYARQGDALALHHLPVLTRNTWEKELLIQSTSSKSLVTRGRRQLRPVGPANVCRWIQHSMIDGAIATRLPEAHKVGT